MPSGPRSPRCGSELGGPRGRPGPRRAALCPGQGTAPLPLCGRGAGPTGGISCSAGAWPEDLWYLPCCTPATGEAGTLRCLEMPDPAVYSAPREGTGAEAWSGWFGPGKGRFQGLLELEPSLALSGICFFLTGQRHFGPFAESSGETRALVAVEPGAKDSQVGLVWAPPGEDRAFWEGDSVGRDVGTCVLSLLEDTEAGSPCLAGRTIRDLRDLKDVTVKVELGWVVSYLLEGHT